MTEPFQIRFAPGVSPDKWLGRWRERHPDAPLEAELVEVEHQLDDVRSGAASMCLARLPVERDGLHVISLYEEQPVVVAGKDHPVAAFDEVDVADLADEALLQPPASVPEWAAVAPAEAVERAAALEPMSDADAVAVVAAGVGVVVLPMSVARLHARKDVVHRPVTGVAGSRVGLVWRVDDEDWRVEEFVGIVRGRTARSSRGTASADGAADAGTPARKERKERKDADAKARTPRKPTGGGTRKAQGTGRARPGRSGGGRRRGR